MHFKWTELTIVLSVCTVLVASQQNSTGQVPTTKAPGILDQFLTLGQGLAMQAISGAMQIGCREGCPHLCEDRVGRYFCMFVCSPCGKFKRSVNHSPAYKGHLTPMPNKFSAYDLNDDGVVSLKELAFVSRQSVGDADVKMVFNMADRNGDQVLTPKELYEGPFVFEMDVSETDYKYCEYVVQRMSRSSRQGGT